DGGGVAQRERALERARDRRDGQPRTQRCREADHARHAYHRHHGGAAAQAGRQQRPQGFHKLLQSLAHGEDIGPISAPLKRCRTTEDGGQTTEDGSTRGRGYPSSVFRRLSSVLRLTNSLLSSDQTFYHMIDPIRRISPWVQGSCVRSLPSPSLL